MSTFDYSWREFIALKSPALSAAGISRVLGETSGAVRCLMYDDQGQPLPASGFAALPSDGTPRQSYHRLMGPSQSGETKPDHDCRCNSC